MTSIYWDIVAKPPRKATTEKKDKTKADMGRVRDNQQNGTASSRDQHHSYSLYQHPNGLDPASLDQHPAKKRPDRGNWSSKAEFLLSCIGFAVGLGNVWRFPYKCYINGGGAFLIPYLLCLAGIGVPMMVMELSFGQFCSQGTIGAWKISPIFKGMGWAMVIVVTLVGIYYNVIVSYILYYLFASFTTGPLPWASCGNWWNTRTCYVPGAPALNHTNGTMNAVNETESYIGNFSAALDRNSNVSSKLTHSAEEYWERYILQISTGLSDTGSVRWELALLLLLSWIIIFLCLVKGVKSSGKVVYFTAVFPYVVLFILLVRGATLPGAGTGILYYITPRPEKLLDAKVWFDAALQIFYSLCPGSGALIMLGSYNKFNNNCLRDGVTVALLNCATSILCGFVVFSVIGFLSHELGVSPDQVVTAGPGLAFVTFSTAISKMPGAPVWAVLFFLMLFTVGLDSQFVAIEVIISGITDVFPGPLIKHKSIFTLGTCIILFFLGLPMITNGGIYLLHLVDSYAAGISLLVLAMLECVVLQWIYGQSSFSEDIACMLGRKPNAYMRLCWRYVTPLLIMTIFIFCLVMHRPLTYGDYVYPGWSNALGWCTAAFSLVMLPLGALVEVWPREEKLVQAIKASLQPSQDWGPYRADDRETWIKQTQRAHSEELQTIKCCQNGNSDQTCDLKCNQIEECKQALSSVTDSKQKPDDEPHTNGTVTVEAPQLDREPGPGSTVYRLAIVEEEEEEDEEDETEDTRL